VENEQEDYVRVVPVRTGNNGGNKIKLGTGIGRDREREKSKKSKKKKKKKKKKKRKRERESTKGRSTKVLLFSDKTRTKKGKSFKRK